MLDSGGIAGSSPQDRHLSSWRSNWASRSMHAHLAKVHLSTYADAWSSSSWSQVPACDGRNTWGPLPASCSPRLHLGLSSCKGGSNEASFLGCQRRKGRRFEIAMLMAKS
mmetsp:Transcript_24522/g.61346  ORF Transcript_24522/g.61346 Transcript_24522/m.61346 type:complete len:110 (-) Transcript_24522:87-416(-)